MVGKCGGWGGRLEAAEECQLEKIKSEQKGFGERE